MCACAHFLLVPQVNCVERVPCESGSSNVACLEMQKCDDATSTTSSTTIVQDPPCQGDLIRLARVPVGFQWRATDGDGIWLKKCPNSPDCMEMRKCSQYRDAETGIQVG